MARRRATLRKWWWITLDQILALPEAPAGTYPDVEGR